MVVQRFKLVVQGSSTGLSGENGTFLESRKVPQDSRENHEPEDRGQGTMPNSLLLAVPQGNSTGLRFLYILDTSPLSDVDLVKTISIL